MQSAPLKYQFNLTTTGTLILKDSDCEKEFKYQQQVNYCNYVDVVTISTQKQSVEWNNADQQTSVNACEFWVGVHAAHDAAHAAHAFTSHGTDKPSQYPLYL